MKTLFFQSSLLYSVFSNFYLKKGAAIRFIWVFFRCFESCKTVHYPHVVQKGFKYLKCRLESLPIGCNNGMLFSQRNAVAITYKF